MISIEEIRQKVIGRFKTVHDIYYPTTLVNYPKFMVVDIEHQADPFVSVELGFERNSQLALGGNEIKPKGRLSVTFYFRSGQGMSGAYSYTDMLATNLGLKNLDGLVYSTVTPVNVESFPGWEGVMNQITFESPLGADCL